MRAERNRTRLGPWFERRAACGAVAGLVVGLLAVARPAQAATDYLELRERLEVGRDELRQGMRSFVRAPGAAAFPDDKPGAAFQKYLDLAWRTVDGRTNYPEAYAALRRFRGRLDPADPTARQALGVFLGDYLQVRYGDDIARELGTLVGFKTYSTVVDRNSDNKEFRASFDHLANLGRALGLQVENHGYETLVVALPAAGAGAAAAAVGVITHVDVPRPIEHKWTQPGPWKLTERNDRFHGAGAFDAKGPLVVNLFALRVLRDAGIELARPVVLVVGASGEELGDTAAAHLGDLQPRPAVLLAADGAYPYGTREMGRLVARVSSARGMKSRAGIQPGQYYIYKMTAGQGFNTVPMESRVWVRYEPPRNTTNPALVQVTKWREEIQAYQRGHTQSVYETYIQEDTLHFFVYSDPGHVLHADQAVNSIYDAAGALLGLPLYGNSAGDVMKWIDGGLQRDPTGKSLGLAFEHPEMGHTWVSPVGFDRVGEEVTVLVDVRWPLGHDAAWIRQRFAAAIQEWNAKNGTKLALGWEPGGLEPVEAVPPAPVREALDEAHALATGEGATPGRAAPTCARALPDAIPFGPESARGGSQAHTRDESISRRELQDHGVASLAALVVLATRPLPSP